MSDIGLRLFQQLKSINAAASKDDYFRDELRSWNVKALEEHLLMAQQNTNESGAHLAPHTQTQLLPQPSEALNGNHSNRVTTTTTTTMATVSSIPCDVNVTPTLHELPLITMGTFDVVPMPMDMPMPTLMPSPNGSPSIDYDETTHDPNGATSNGNHSHHNGHSIANGVANGGARANNGNSDTQKAVASVEGGAVASSMRKKRTTKSKSKSPGTKKNTSTNRRKRKASSADIYDPRNMDISSASSSVSQSNAPALPATQHHRAPPPPKKQRKSAGKIVRPNEWNASALKKLYSLRRQVVNSSWFWEPVDELKHTAPNYYLVCPCPSDYGTICKRLERFEYAELDVFLRDCELVFINARMYNTSTHHVHAASLKLEKKFKELMDSFVRQYLQFGSERTLSYWEKAQKDYTPFAVPIDD